MVYIEKQWKSCAMEWKNIFFVNDPLRCSGLLTFFVELSPNLRHDAITLIIGKQRTRSIWLIISMDGLIKQIRAYFYTQGFDFISVRLAVEKRKSLT